MTTHRTTAPELGLILAAGLGSRLDSVKTTSQLKPLLEFGGEPLILRVIAGMERAGCRKVIVVVGYLAEELRAVLTQRYQGRIELQFVRNEDYERSNGLSVLAAKKQLDQPFILSMSDHLISDSMWRLARSFQPLAGGAALLIDRKIDQVFDLDDATKVVTNGDALVDIGKQLTAYDAIDTGVFVATPGLVEAIAQVAAARGDASLSQGIAALATNELMEVLDIGDAFWADIDTPDMLADAARKLGV